MKFESALKKLRIRLTKMRVPGRIIFIATGVMATVWFLIRVIPKPSRAGYPCMKTALPIMSTFVLWLVSFTGAFAAFKSVGVLFKKSRYLPAAAVIVLGLAMSAIFINIGSQKTAAINKGTAATVYHPSNQPMGVPVGINPGRVVWAWDADATNENCTNTGSDPYVSNDNTDQTTVDEMINSAITQLAGESTASLSWDVIFKDFNYRKGKGSVSYSSEETIFIKVNEGTSDWRSDNDIARRTSNRPMTETSPQVTLSVLKQLVNEAGVPQENIWVADPRSHVWQETYVICSAVFPNVKYGDKKTASKSSAIYDTRATLTKSTEVGITYSDKGAAMAEAVTEQFFTQIEDADYMINLAALKAHARAGITLTAKNHFGTHNGEDGSWHLHPGLVAPDNDNVERADYGMYRVQVDLMGSSLLGQNTIFFLVDGLWGGTEATEYPVKWTMAPFNNDWPNSIFISQDQVALESVCFDFLRNEATVGSSDWKDRPNFAQGVDDYLHQAADKANWPVGITYDPDNSGAAIGSLGIHEHWNNPTLKQYSRNMGDDKGIELVSIPESLVATSGFEAKEAATLPVIDGVGDDDCWKTVEWNGIDQLWIPWGDNNIPLDDFNGRFKVMWSSTTDLMYFVVETTDDVLVGGYTYPDDGYYNFDIVEVFIDEDASGGGHIFDDGTDNAENAFSYHINIDHPADGETTSTATVEDIAGTGWGDKQTPNYFSHFPDFTVKRNGNTLTWEFSMEVHNDTYDHANATASLVDLSEGKVMGLSMAYCENDTPGTNRDNFFGSVEVTEERYNSHWENSDDYGVLSLVAAGAAINHAPIALASISDLEFTEKDVEVTIVEDVSILFNDEDGDVLSYSVASPSESLVFTIDGTTLKGMAKPGYRGTAVITLSAEDDEQFSAAIQFSVTVPNAAPYVASEISDFVVEPGETKRITLNLSNKFKDPDGDILTYTGESDNDELTVVFTGLKLEVVATADFTGEAIVTITADDGDLDVSDNFKVSSTVGIAIEAIENSLELYPNPVTTDHLSVEYSSNYQGDVMLRIIGISGQLYSSKYLQKAQGTFSQTISVADLAKGIYILEIHEDRATVNRTFVK
jgi:hypothetical protein